MCRDDPRWLKSAGRALAVLIFGAGAVAAGCSSSHGGLAAGTTTRPPDTTRGASGPGSTATTGVATVTVMLTPIGSSPSCEEATAAGTPDALLSAFRAARVRGSGAEQCLTAEALAAYCTASHPCADEFQASPGPICLYDCRGYRVKDISFEVTRAGDGTFSVYVGIDAQPAVASGGSSAGYPPSAYENLTIGPGMPFGSASTGRLMIVEATSSA